PRETIAALRVSFLFAGPEEIREVDAEPEALLRLRAVHPLIDGKEHAPRQAVSLVQEERRRTDEHHPAAGIGHLQALMPGCGSRVADRLDEEAQVGLGIIEAPRLRTVAVDEAGGRDPAETIAAALERVLIAGAGPRVVRARRVARGHGDVGRRR